MLAMPPRLPHLPMPCFRQEGALSLHNSCTRTPSWPAPATQLALAAPSAEDQSGASHESMQMSHILHDARHWEA